MAPRVAGCGPRVAGAVVHEPTATLLRVKHVQLGGVKKGLKPHLVGHHHDLLPVAPTRRRAEVGGRHAVQDAQGLSYTWDNRERDSTGNLPYSRGEYFDSTPWFEPGSDRSVPVDTFTCPGPILTQTVVAHPLSALAAMVRVPPLREDARHFQKSLSEKSRENSTAVKW